MAETGPASSDAGGLHSNGFPTFGLAREAAALASLTADSFLDQEVNGYRIKRLIGEGGMSWVFEAAQDVPTKSVALKISKPGTDRRLEKEANLLSEIEHRGIARVHAGGRVETPAGRLSYMATELIAGGAHLDEYCWVCLPITQDRVALFAEVCAVVAHAHSAEIIHRDLKPSNILVDTTGKPKVIDFGIARSCDTNTHTISGTLDYMSPEQRQGRQLTAASDVYALGLILQKLLSPERPTEGTEGPATGDPLPAHKLPTALQRIINRCLHAEADRRYADAGCLEKALRRWLRWQLPEWLDWRRATWPAAATRWLEDHRRPIAQGSLVALLAAAVTWSLFIRPDMRSFARAVAAAGQTVTADNPAGDGAAIAEATRVWRLARLFSAQPPLELSYLASRNADIASARLVASGADILALGSVPDPWAAIGSPGGVALIDLSGSESRVICRLSNPAAISAVTFSADGKYLVAGDDAGGVLVWDTAHLRGSTRNTTPRRVRLQADLQTPDAGGVLALASAPKATDETAWCIALAADGGIFRVECPGGGQEPKADRLVTVPGGRAIALLDSGRLLAIARDSGVVEFRDLAQPATLLRSEQIGAGPIDLACDVTGKTLYAVTPGRLSVWHDPRSERSVAASLPALQTSRPPRLVVAAADACLIALQSKGEPSLHCFRDLRGRFGPGARWGETLNVPLPAEIQAAAWLPGAAPSLVTIDPRGYLSTGR
jgi:hypothetical protein